MRRSFHGLSDTQLSVADVLLSLHSFPREAIDQRDHVYMSYSVARAIDWISNHFKVDYTMSADDVFRHAAFELNGVSGQPLSLSLTDSARSELPSWTPDWTPQSMRFLLNHATSKFPASPYAVCQVDYRHQTDHHRQTQPPDANITFSGLLVDVVKHLSSFLPPRRHCDHYVVNGANSYFLSEWHEFAREHSFAKRSDYLVSLAFADTIQARGCGHVLEDAGKAPQNRVQEVTEFLDFLEDGDSAAHETDLIRVVYAACFPSHDRRFAVTKNGRFGLVPEAAKRGDLVCIPHGSRVPYILRPYKEKDLYQNIGEAFVHGLMHGEAGEIEVQDIRTFSLH
ncbi:hypothetical protein yc1106_07652 [Curvularia clavata]|uniref:Uncharacterized protein n=1 Tax=Curvularia clavata TaxID=95742 RepID=A0A9Q9DTZ5_CURCL|nr:hypothetical protein yc1106_07652 [Curvularia clavata]